MFDIPVPYLGLCVEADALLAVEVGVAEERAAGSREGHHGKRHGDGHVHSDLQELGYELMQLSILMSNVKVCQTNQNIVHVTS